MADNFNKEPIPKIVKKLKLYHGQFLFQKGLKANDIFDKNELPNS